MSNKFIVVESGRAINAGYIKEIYIDASSSVTSKVWLVMIGMDDDRIHLHSEHSSFKKATTELRELVWNCSVN